MVLRFRPDADVVDDAPLVRRIQPFIMPTRGESVVFFDQELDAGLVDAQVASLRAQGVHASVLHVVVAAAVKALAERPRLNRFVAGGRLWQRRGTWVSFTAKTEKSDQGAVLAMKRRIDPDADIVAIARAVNDGVGEARSGKPTATEKELRVLLALPVVLLGLRVRFVGVLDRFGLLPRFFIDGDPLFASLFVTNLGALGMDAPHHHLFEYGNIPLFCMIGQKRHAFFVDDAGVVRAREVYPLRWTFDERVEDGMYCLRALELLKARAEGRAVPPAS
jgi:cell division protein ZapA (FtsZ GTPase activity inhibitor)